MITENLSTLKIHKLTKQQYDREAAKGTLDPTAIYLYPDDIPELITEITGTVTDKQTPTAKAVYDFVQSAIQEVLYVDEEVTV